MCVYTHKDGPLGVPVFLVLGYLTHMWGMSALVPGRELLGQRLLLVLPRPPGCAPGQGTALDGSCLMPPSQVGDGIWR